MADKSELTMLQEFVDAAPNTQTGALVQWGINRIEELEGLRTANRGLIADMEKDQKSLLLRITELEAELKLADEGLDFWQKKHTELVDGLRELANTWVDYGDTQDCAEDLIELLALLGKESEDG